jgi:LPS export ABC transporter protein LptC
MFRFTTIIILFITLFSSCENDIAVVNTINAENEKVLPIEADKNAEIMYSDSAQVRAKLTAPILNRFEGKKKYMELPKGMEVIFYDEHRNQQTKLTADYGIGFESNEGMEHMEAKRNVVVINQKGDTLNTEHLIWNAVTKKIFTDAFVKITTKDDVIWGDGLTSNQDFSDYTITNVKGEVSAKENEASKKGDK